MAYSNSRKTATQPTDGTTRAAIKQIVFTKDSFIIAKADKGDGTISVLGNMTQPKIGQLYEFHGQWKKNDRYNSWDFHFTSYRTIMPDDRSGIYHYLVRVGQWVGPETAQRLIDTFGNDALEVIKRDPERVRISGIPGLTPQRLSELSKSLLDNEKIETSMVEVGQMVGNQLGMGVVQKAIDRWGSDAGAIIRRSPHRLMELPGIGFIKADSVFFKLGGDPQALRRHVCALIHTLEENASHSGHTRAKIQTIMQECSSILKCSIHQSAIDVARRTGSVFIEGEYISLASFARAEHTIARRLLEISKTNMKPLALTSAMESAIESLESEQRQAFEAARCNPLSIMIGAPGTGKTYTMARIVQMFMSCGLSGRLAAPTGKAAKQMHLALSSVLGANCPIPRTIHSILRPTSTDGDFRFGHNEENPIESCQFIVIDEVSMVDVRLMASLLVAIPPNTRVLIVGDQYQLPSVGAGAVLRDTIDSSLFCITELKTIKRNAGLIVRACHEIKDGRTPSPSPKLDVAAGENWRHIETTSYRESIEAIKSLLNVGIPSKGFDSTWQTQIVCATNERGSLSCSAVNDASKAVLNPGEKIHKQDFGIGDKVINTKNGEVESVETTTCPSCNGAAPDVESCTDCDATGIVSSGGIVRIVNGDIGIIESANDKHIFVQFMWPTRKVRIGVRVHNLRLAYGVTCHKMQGSEMPVVILPLDRGIAGMPMVNREWIYTAMSRARSAIITVGNLEFLPLVIEKTGRSERVTSLVKRLIEWHNKNKGDDQNAGPNEEAGPVGCDLVHGFTDAEL